MRVLHVVKTTVGASWAVLQAKELTRRGVEVHVALPTADGQAVESWHRTGARIHRVDLGLPVRSPWRFGAMRRAARSLVREVAPDLIHSHFVSTTLLLRMALGAHHPVPRIFQVPGPLHLEHSLYRRGELATAGLADHWVASSQYTKTLYGSAGVPAQRLHLSYYGTDTAAFATVRTGALRRMLGLPEDALVVGNVNHMYPPKRFLGQRVGLKAHEDVIAALALATREDPRLVGLLVGGAWGGARRYEERLRARALALGGGRIRMTGALPHEQVRAAWCDFDVAIHVPLSENCGGVHEAMVAGVPVIAGRVGGLPELVQDGSTGRTVPTRCPEALARAVLDTVADLESARALARNGRELVLAAFDYRRTAAEIEAIYRHVLDPARSPRPVDWAVSAPPREPPRSLDPAPRP